MNGEIECDELRVSVMNTNVDGGKDEALGVLSRADALAKAKDLGAKNWRLATQSVDAGGGRVLTVRVVRA